MGIWCVTMVDYNISWV